MIDRDQLREALDRLESLSPSFREPIVEEAARLVADSDTLVITKVDGEWPEWVVAAGKKACAYYEAKDALILAYFLDALLEGQPK